MRNMVEASRLVPIIEEQIEKNSNSTFHTQIGDKNGGLEIVAFMTGISRRTISDIRQGHRNEVGFSALDKILTKLDLEYLSYLPPEEGGFKDVYDRMITYNRRKDKIGVWRPMDPCPDCGKQKQARSKTCHDCYVKRCGLKKNRCVDCGLVIKNSSTRCWSCWQASKKTVPEGSKRWMKDATSHEGFGGDSKGQGKASLSRGIHKMKFDTKRGVS